MRDLVPAQFSDFFEAVHSTDGERRRPFGWQMRLAGQVLDQGRWDETICVPTSCGKTAVLDLAVFDLALQASKVPRERKASRRICFVVDRRLVVDEVTDHARRMVRVIRKALGDPCAAPVLKAVADRLCSLAPEDGEPIRVVRLRGGVYLDDGWASDPLTPTILVSTVDQIGSRLLFRGYGTSRRNRPVHAGLLAFDTKIIVDEAHLSTVFTKTLDRIRRYQSLAEKSPLSIDHGLGIVRMSATITGADEDATFALLEKDRRDPRLRSRLEAHKKADLIDVRVPAITKEMRKKQSERAREQERKNREEMVKKIVSEARRIADSNPTEGLRNQVIGVIVNRVATARQVWESLRSWSVEVSGKPSSDENSVLLTGRIRPYDRDRLLECWLPRIRAGRNQETESTYFVVATQTVEVGANLDFDALVSEAAPLDALRQRFGRLDRLGRRHKRHAPTFASIVVRSDLAKNSADDPIYGAAISQTWKWLKQIASTQKSGRSRRSTVDFGINPLDEQMNRNKPDLAAVLTKSPDCPLLFPAHLDAWVQTNPRPEPDPDVGPFLHGRSKSTADVMVVWRADIRPSDQANWEAIVSLMPPITREALPVPIYEVKAWLSRSLVAEAEIADIEGVSTDGREAGNGGRPVLRWRGREGTGVAVPAEIQPGETIVVPASYGGCDPFGWMPSSTASVTDVACQCLAQLIVSYPAEAFRKRKFRLRLHPDLMPECDQSTRERLRVLLSATATAVRLEDQDASPKAKQLLGALEPHLEDPYIKVAVKALLEREFPVDPYPDGSDGILITDSLDLDLEAQLHEDEHCEEEPEGDEASIIGRPLLLAQHRADVESAVVEFAQNAGLSDELTRSLRLAGCWHDEGKRDPRFQAWLHGSELKALASEDPIAKSGRDSSSWKPSTLFGYPGGARHEFVSVRLLERYCEVAHYEGNCDLAKLLIGTHHGFGRPFPPVSRDPRPVDIPWTDGDREIVVSSRHRLDRLEGDWVELFWQMVRRFGWWGLAYLESILVTADRTVSAREALATRTETKGKTSK